MPSFTSSDGVRLDYSVSGEPTGRAVVLIAGFRAPATSWKPQRRALEKAGYRVIAFDRRGHGTSAVADTGNTMQSHGQDLHELLAAVAPTDAVLVGGSMGGNTIWSTIAQYGTEGISGVVIVDQTPKMLNTADWPHGFYGYDESVRDTLFAAGVPDPGVVPLKTKGFVRIARILRALPLKGARRPFSAGELELLNDHATADWREAIASADVPVLFVAGEQSEFWPATHATAAAAIAPRGVAAPLPQAGHATSIEQPKAFNEVLLAFLRSLP
jgi:pimeloyl-ACP methyl ester carboxylesterase